MKPIFVTGTGTDVGKTIVSAIITEALQADYWKPVQAGYDDGTDSLRVENLVPNKKTIIHPELYKLKLPASPHISAREEGRKIKVKQIVSNTPKTNNRLVIEGAGGLMVPLNKNEFILTLIKKLKAKVIIVSKNELGSINHSLLTAAVLKEEKVNVVGWIFNESYMNYEHEIASWSGFPVIGSIGHLDILSKETIRNQAHKLLKGLNKFL
jgi:dethiobiotin synthetase